jgi:hypothetical protein
VHEALATADRPGKRTTTSVGPIEFGVDTIVSVMCSGLSDIDVTIQPGDDGTRSSRCLGGFDDIEWRVEGRAGDSFRILITADEATSWRLVVYDLG